MPGNRTQNIVLVLVMTGAAFAWGYSGNSKVVSPETKQNSDMNSLAVDSTSLKQTQTPDTQPEGNSPKSTGDVAKPATFQGFPSMKKLGSGGKPTNTLFNAPAPGVIRNKPPTAQGPRSVKKLSNNPYAQFMKSMSQKNQNRGSTGVEGSDTSGNSNLGGTVSDFKQGPVSEGRKRRRNAYFDKLSEQLKELQGNKGPVGDANEEAASQTDLVDEQDNDFNKELIQTPSDNLEDQFDPSLENEDTQFIPEDDLRGDPLDEGFIDDELLLEELLQ